MAKVLSFEEWAQIHQEIFKSHGFPIAKLGPALYDKLVDFKEENTQDFDIEMRSTPTLVFKPKGKKKNTLAPTSQIFITEHIWSDDPKELQNSILTDEKLRTRLQPYLEQNDEQFSHGLFPKIDSNDPKKADFYGKTEDFSTLLTQEQFALIEAIDIRKTKYTISDLTEKLGKETLRAVSCDEASVSIESLIAAFPNLEFINGKFTEKWSEWALLYISNNNSPQLVTELNLKDRNIKSVDASAFKRFTGLLKADVRGNAIKAVDLKNAIPSLLSIKCDDEKEAIDSGLFVFVNGKDNATGNVELSIPDIIWEHMQVTGADWGLPNEKALAIHHKLDCNFMAMPCGSPYFGRTFFVFWPIKNISEGDEVTANLFPYIPFIDPSDVDPKPPLTPMRSLKSKFASSVTRKRPIKAFIEYEPFIKGLHSDKFVVTNDPQEADLLWLTIKQQSDFSNIYATGKLINQIEGEKALTLKDYLYLTCTEYMGQVEWLPETFILSDENDICRFLQRHKYLKEHNESCAFVVKAFNMTRAASMVVSESPAEILKHASGTYRLTQRYISNPLNIFGCKFDLRFIIMLKSVKPFELFVYKVFWPRLAPKQWALDDFSDYERHFTVMNYVSPEKVTHKTYKDFIEQFRKENPSIAWETVLERIYTAIRDMVVCGAQKMKQSPFTKSFYGVDVMITNDYKPMILECNFQPDCLRACDLCPTFVDDIFEVLFVDQPVKNENVVQLNL